MNGAVSKAAGVSDGYSGFPAVNRFNLDYGILRLDV